MTTNEDMTSNFPVQTRNEEGALRFFDSIREAMIHAEKDSTVWKVSFTSHTGERIRLIRQDKPGPISRLWGRQSRWIYFPI